MRRIIIGVISFYQKTISPDHSILGRYFYPFGCCRFTPTCSAYAKIAVQHHGSKGLLYAVRRVLRCTPWASGGSDPVPFISN